MTDAAMREPIELVFGDQKFTVQPLSIEQAEKIEAVYLRDPPYTNVQRAREIIRAALSEDYPDVDVGKLKTDIKSLADQMVKVITLAGFREVAAGETAAAAAETAPSSGETSEAA